MSVGMPELKSWQTWKVSMTGDTVEVAMHVRITVPDTGSTFGSRIRFGTLDSGDYSTEEQLIKAIEDEAWAVFVIEEQRDKRREWIRKNFS